MSRLRIGTADMLKIMCSSAIRRVREGYYDITSNNKHKPLSLKRSIENVASNAVIAEVKISSPSHGKLAKNVDIVNMVRSMVKGGAVGISIITDPDHFSGSLSYIQVIREEVNVPILMKDFIVDEAQIQAARNLGADAVLLIMRIFKERYTRLNLEHAIKACHDLGLEVLLETSSREELLEALGKDVEAIGVNSRDLKTLKVNHELFKEAVKHVDTRGKILVAESGISSPYEIRMLKELGYSAFLVGTSIVTSPDIESKVREMVYGG